MTHPYRETIGAMEGTRSEPVSVYEGSSDYADHQGEFYSQFHPTSSRNSIRSASSHQRAHSRSSSFESKRHKSKRSVDLSHLYLLPNKDSSFSLAESTDLSQTLITQYLGENSDSALVPRMKTIEMYRENVKKTHDPEILFEYAQYVLQTALTINTPPNAFSLSHANSSSVTINTDATAAGQELVLKKQLLNDALHYLKKLAAKGYPDAQYLLADAYSSGAFGKTQPKEAFSLFQAAAKHGHIESAYRTAHCFEDGFGTARDARRAIEFLKFAASRNHPAAMYKLGVYQYYSKMGCSSDVNTKQSGIKWLTRAVSKANELTAAAPYELGKIYEQGFLDIVIPDKRYALELYAQAASLGHIPSAAILGKVYETGNQIIPQDTDLSVHYYTQAALGGDAESMLALCAWYLVGAPPTLEKDDIEGFQWALKAAKQGLPKAQFAVGHFYEKGIGIEADLGVAKQWYEKAAVSGDPRALKKLGGALPAAPPKLSKRRSVLDFTRNVSETALNTSHSVQSQQVEQKQKLDKQKPEKKKKKGGCIIA